MRRSTTLLVLVLALFAVACTDDPVTETALADDPPPSSTTDAPVVDPSTTTTAASPTTAAPTTTEAPVTTTTEAATPSTTEPLGMCGELIPVVTDEGTLCLTPEQAEWGVGTDPFWEGELPPLVVVGDQGEVTRLVPNETFGLDEVPDGSIDGWVVEVRAASDGSLVVERYTDDEEEYWAEVAIIRPDGSEEIVPRATRLFDVTIAEGQEVVLVADIPWTHDGSAEPVEARLLSDPGTTLFDLGPASGDFFEVEHAAVRGGLGVVGGYVDTTEFIELTPVIGDPAMLADPLVDLQDARPPYATAVTLDPEGRNVTWAEGPDHDAVLGEYVEQDWVIRSVDSMSGEERLWWPIPAPAGDVDGLWVASIHDLDDFVIVNRTGWVGENWVSYPALVIDFTVEEPETWELPIAGLAAPVPVVG